MPYQIQLKRKNRSAVDSIMGIKLDDPKVGDTIECPENVKAKITAIESTVVGTQLDQRLTIIKADEI